MSDLDNNNYLVLLDFVRVVSAMLDGRIWILLHLQSQQPLQDRIQYGRWLTSKQSRGKQAEKKKIIFLPWTVNLTF